MILRRAGYPPSGGTKFGTILLQLFRNHTSEVWFSSLRWQVTDAHGFLCRSSMPCGFLKNCSAS